MSVDGGMVFEFLYEVVVGCIVCGYLFDGWYFGVGYVY